MSPGSIFLAASVDDALLEMTRRATATQKSVRRALRVAVSYAAAWGEPGWGIKPFVERTFATAEVTVVRVAGEDGAMPASTACDIFAGADVILLGPGDPVLGARRLIESGAVDGLREAHTRGASLLGVSAGSIMLGSWWAQWPDPEAPSCVDRGALVACTGLLPGIVVDCHDEDDGWGELALVETMLRDAGEAVAELVGIPTGAALVVGPDGGTEAAGELYYPRRERRAA